MTDQPGPGEDAHPDPFVDTPNNASVDTPDNGPGDRPAHDHPDHEDGMFPAPVPAAPRTGDTAIDAATAQLEQSGAGSLDDQIEAGETVHRTLQGRLSDLGGE